MWRVRALRIPGHSGGGGVQERRSGLGSSSGKDTELVSGTSNSFPVEAIKTNIWGRLSAPTLEDVKAHGADRMKLTATGATGATTSCTFQF